MTAEEKQRVFDILGEESGRRLLESGIIGITLEKVDDIKCIHAHTADFLMRGENEIGKIAMGELAKRGIDSSGCEYCHQQCDTSVPKEDATWWYMSTKNKIKLRTLRDRRRARRQQNTVKGHKNL